MALTDEFGGTALQDNPASPAPTPVTFYSLGTQAGGTDETNDSWTNRGYTSTGKNLTPGVVAVNTKVYPLGTVFQDQETGNKFIAADRHGNKNPNVVDIYVPPDQYPNMRHISSRNLVPIGKVDKVGKTAQEIQNQLQTFGQNTDEFGGIEVQQPEVQQTPQAPLANSQTDEFGGVPVETSPSAQSDQFGGIPVPENKTSFTSTFNPQTGQNVISPSDATRPIGFLESFSRNARSAVDTFNQFAYEGMGIFPQAESKVIGAITGHEPDFYQHYYDQTIAPLKAQQAQLAPQPNEDWSGIGAQLGKGLGPLVRDIPLMAASGGIAPEAEGGSNLAKYVYEKISHGIASMTPTAAIEGSQAQQRAIEAGKTPEQAAGIGLATAALTAGQGAIPLAAESAARSLPLRFIERAVKGGVAAFPVTELNQYAQSKLNGEPYTFDPQQTLIQSLPLGIMAGALGGRGELPQMIHSDRAVAAEQADIARRTNDIIYAPKPQEAAQEPVPTPETQNKAAELNQAIENTRGLAGSPELTNQIKDAYRTNLEPLMPILSAENITVEPHPKEGAQLGVAYDENGNIRLRLQHPEDFLKGSTSEQATQDYIQKILPAKVDEEAFHISNLVGWRNEWLQTGEPDFQDFVSRKQESIANDLRQTSSNQEVQSIIDAYTKGKGESLSDQKLASEFTRMVGQRARTGQTTEDVQILSQAERNGDRPAGSILRHLLDTLGRFRDVIGKYLNPQNAPQSLQDALQTTNQVLDRYGLLQQKEGDLNAIQEQGTTQSVLGAQGTQSGEQMGLPQVGEGNPKSEVFAPRPEAQAPEEISAAAEPTGTQTSGIARRVAETFAPEASQPGEGISREESLARGQQLLRNGANPSDISERVKNGEGFTADDLAVMQANALEKRQQAELAYQQLRKDPNNPKLNQNFKDAEQASRDAIAQSKVLQTQWARMGMAQQGEIDIDTGSFVQLKQAFREDHGREPTPGEEQKLKNIADKTQKADEEVDKAKDKYDQAIRTANGETKIPDELRNQFADRIAENPNVRKFNFTQQDIANLWKYAKDKYIDQGVKSLDDTIRGIARDTGLKYDWVADALTKPKAISKITDELYGKMSNRRSLVQGAKLYLRNMDTPMWKKIIKGIWETPFSLAVYGHGTVGAITHAGANIFRPSTWKAYWPNFINQAKFFAKASVHEKAMNALVRDSNFLIAKRAGLANDPNLTYTDYGTYANFFGMKAGKRGFDALKTMRQSMFNQIWDNVPASIKSDPESAREFSKAYAQTINHATGVIGKNETGFLPTAAKAVNPIAFAARLEASRWARVIGDPIKTADTFLSWNKATPAERSVALSRLRNAAEFSSVYLGTLALNQAILSASGSKNSINFNDPSKNDWLKHKIAGHTVAVDGGLLAPFRLLGRVVYDSLQKPQKELRGESRTATVVKDIGQYALGKAAPAVQVVAESLTGEQTYNGRKLPWSKDKGTPNHPKMTWKEFALSHAPIPVAGASQVIYDSMRERGMSKPDIEDYLRGLAAFGAELTGARVGDIHEPKPKQTGFGGFGKF